MVGVAPRRGRTALPARGRSVLACPLAGEESARIGAGSDVPSPWRRGGGMAMATILVIGAVAACCALCAYGISGAVRRSRERRAQNA